MLKTNLIMLLSLFIIQYVPGKSRGSFRGKQTMFPAKLPDAFVRLDSWILS